MIINIYCDGGSRGNPGPAACAFIAEVDGKIIFQDKKLLGKRTNNYAEYWAVIIALKWLKENSFAEICFNLDSLLVVQQLNGFYKVRSENIRDLFLTVKDLQKNISGKINFKYIPRIKNVLADALVNCALDEN